MAQERLADQQRLMREAKDAAATAAERELRDMMKMKSNITMDDDEDDGNSVGTAKLDAKAGSYGAVCGVSWRKARFELPIIKEPAYFEPAKHLQRLRDDAERIRPPLGNGAPSSLPGSPDDRFRILTEFQFLTSHFSLADACGSTH